jgi:hypothetical protein
VRFSAEGAYPWNEILPTPETMEAAPRPPMLCCAHRTRVAATSEEPDMTQVLPPRTRSIGTYAAVLLFIGVYAGVLLVVFAPKDMIAAQTGAIFAEGE